MATVVVNAPLNLTNNLALNRPSYTDNSISGNTANLANDGNVNTRWETIHQPDEVGGADLPHWWYVKLDTVYNIDKVVIVWDGAAASIYAIQTSPDGNKWTTVDSTSNGAYGATDSFDLSTLNVKSQYLRVYCYVRVTTYGFSIHEFRAFGTKATAPLPTSKIIINPNTVQIKKGLTTTFTPTGYDVNGNITTLSGGTWSTSGGGTISSSGVFSATTVGTFTITYKNGSISSTTTVTVVADYTTNVTEIQQSPNDDISYFPNPTTDVLNINFKTEATVADLYIINVNGKVVSKQILKPGSSTVSVRDLSAGLYFIQVKTDQTVKTGKFIKQ